MKLLRHLLIDPKTTYLVMGRFISAHTFNGHRHILGITSRWKARS